MKVGLKGILATTAAAAALFAGAQVALADGMPRGPGYAVGPGLWNGGYLGFESGWDWDSVSEHYTKSDTHSSWDRDVVSVGLFAGYQHQFGPLVLGVEVNVISNQFDENDKVYPAHGVGNCPSAIGSSLNCVGRITDEITIGPRVGWALGKFMPYVTGGWATGEVNFRTIGQAASGTTPPTNPAGFATTTSEADARQYGYFAGGGLDWKVSRNAVIGVEYRHTDLGSDTTGTICQGTPSSCASSQLSMRQHAESDAVFLRGSLLFGGRDYEPLK